ncbi:GGDEF domain-containing protein [Halopseudomonas pelagia]|uniref:GGDEF domain-containing protein n=1 Tax=Halopseudomonas pelagia TaxID=553151 RepID=UPI0003A77250|nr:GGDEF domain-containing protein [Halopseudomonas pelagia]|tara:strand:+ start:2604 stop:3836 length:1233 start_codon:yes stop_codon:yes gene_type:complete
MPGDLDLATLGVALSLVTLSMTLLLSIAAWHAGSEKGLRHWALGNFALMLGLLLNVNQDHIHHGLSVVLANGLMTLGIGVTWLGIRAFKGTSQPQVGPIIAALVVMLLLWVFRFHYDSLAARLGIASLVLATMSLLCARELLISAEQPLRTGYWLAGGVALFCGLGLTLRAIASLTSLSPAVAISNNPLQSATLLGAMVAQIGLASGFILMTHYRTAMALHQLSEKDALTGTLNRRSLHQQATQILSTASERKLPVTLIMLDADHFKRINDEFGHQTGDAVLCHMVARIRLHLRAHDLLGRFGGEEFVLILPGLDTVSAHPVAERIRQGLSSQPWHTEETPVPLSVSLGVACSDQQGYVFDALLGAADAALYQAKALGRNRVELALHPGSDPKDQMALRLLSQFRHNLDV